MPFSTVTDKFQITIPKKVRNALNIKRNDKIIFVINGDQMILERVSGNIMDIKLPHKKSLPEKDFKEIREEVKKWRGKRLGEKNNQGSS